MKWLNTYGLFHIHGDVLTDETYLLTTEIEQKDYTFMVTKGAKIGSCCRGIQDTLFGLVKLHPATIGSPKVSKREADRTSSLKSGTFTRFLI